MKESYRERQIAIPPSSTGIGKNTLAVIQVVLCALVIVNLIRGRSSYDLLFVFFVSILSENIQQYRMGRRRENLVAVFAMAIAIIGIFILYIDSLL